MLSVLQLAAGYATVSVRIYEGEEVVCHCVVLRCELLVPPLVWRAGTGFGQCFQQVIHDSPRLLGCRGQIHRFIPARGILQFFSGHPRIAVVVQRLEIGLTELAVQFAEAGVGPGLPPFTFAGISAGFHRQRGQQPLRRLRASLHVLRRLSANASNDPCQALLHALTEGPVELIAQVEGLYEVEHECEERHNKQRGGESERRGAQEQHLLHDALKQKNGGADLFDDEPVRYFLAGLSDLPDILPDKPLAALERCFEFCPPVPHATMLHAVCGRHKWAFWPPVRGRHGVRHADRGKPGVPAAMSAATGLRPGKPDAAAGVLFKGCYGRTCTGVPTGHQVKTLRASLGRRRMQPRLSSPPMDSGSEVGWMP